MTKTSAHSDQLYRVEVEESLPGGWKEEIKGDVEMCVAGLQALAGPGVGIHSQASSQVEVGENPGISDKGSDLNDENLVRNDESKAKVSIKNTSKRKYKNNEITRQKNTAAQNNYIINLYGLSAW